MTSTLSRPTRHSHLPTRLRPADLLRITDQGVADVLDGRYDYLLPRSWDATRHESVRLHSDDDIDLWLVSWSSEKITELHDHAGSLGALTVVSGSLREYHWTGDRLRVRTLDEGDQASFPLGWVHDLMRNPTPPGEPARSTPTLTVQAYAPALTAMSYYEVTGRGLRRTRTELTDQPE